MPFLSDPRPGLSRVLALALALAASTVSADTCNDLHVAAKQWEDIAQAIDVIDFDVLPEAEAEAVIEEVMSYAQLTREFAAELADSDERDQARLGRYLLTDIESLEQAEYQEDAVESIDGIAATMGEVVQLCVGAIQDAGGGVVQLSFEAPADESHNFIAQAIAEDATLVRMAADVGEFLFLPQNLPVDFRSCAVPNAYYDRRSQRITMCYEFYELFAAIGIGAGIQDEAAIMSLMLEAGTFFLLHEIAHALVHILEIPITGREEDAVDNLATLVILDGEDMSMLISAIQTFQGLSLLEDSSEQAPAVWGEHSLSSQRFYDMLCLAYGSDPAAYASLVGEAGLPESRAVRCESEYAQKESAWSRLLEPHFAE